MSFGELACFLFVMLPELDGVLVFLCRDVLDTTLNYGAHVKFVTKWLDKLEAEEKTAAEPAADAPAAAGDTPAATTPTAANPEGPTVAELGRAAEALQA